MGERKPSAKLGKQEWNQPPKVDPEAVLQIIRNEGLSVPNACKKAGMKYNLFYTWMRRGKFDLVKRVAHAKEAYSKRLAIDTAKVFDESSRPPQLVAFLEQFKRTGEQIDSCRFAGISFRQLQDICNPAHVNYNWWFATEFDALLEEQRQQLRDKAILGGLADGKSAAQVLRDIERVQRPAGKDEDSSESVSDDQILEALERIAAKVNATQNNYGPSELPTDESGPLPIAPS